MAEVPPATDDYHSAGCNFAHSCKRMRVALWVFPSKRCELWEGNRENLKHGNGNHDNSNTRGSERKTGAPLLQCKWDSTVASNNTETDTPKLYILIFDVFYTF